MSQKNYEYLNKRSFQLKSNQKRRQIRITKDLMRTGQLVGLTTDSLHSETHRESERVSETIGKQ